jgi:hypothetical protein
MSQARGLQFVDLAEAKAFQKSFAFKETPQIERLVRLLHFREFLFGFTPAIPGFDHELRTEIRQLILPYYAAVGTLSALRTDTQIMNNPMM